MKAKICSCGMPQSYPMPHEHDLTDREKRIMEISFKAGEKRVVEWINSLRDVPLFSTVEGTNLKIPEQPGKLLLMIELQDFLKSEGIE